MEIQFHGAAQAVTGSMHLLTVGDEKILLECGLFQGRRQEAYERNCNLPFDPKELTAMVLSHAHMDHSGNIPQLVKGGYEGNIFCTHATQDLCRVMLRDSAHIQEMDAKYMNKRQDKKGLPHVEPVYSMADAEASMSQFVGLGYNRSFMITPNVQVTFLDAGHILGSAIVILDIKENGTTKRLTFTGDLGRNDQPVIKDPVPVKETDFFITESTYGNRTHDAVGDMKAKLQSTIDRTVKRGGKIIVPSFSVGRTQELVYFLHELFNEGALPEIPIYIDSPLSVNITEVFRLHPECFDDETREEFLSNHQDPFGFYRLKYIRQVEESKKLNLSKEPCMIISASGMCEAGRILHHLKNNVSDPKNTVLVVGFMAENTLGRRIVERKPEIKIFGEVYPLKAEVVITNGFSAHADKDELIGYFNQLDKNRLAHTFIVHGEPDSTEAYASSIRDTGFKDVSVPVRGEKFQL
ncbi:MBL fold metallo-hydrolase [candidate division KSB1 bacterium]|nr:MBL fold metallo-hydrolase [candidate division KSB1 bacterium]